jgi:hypothetical protein
MRRALSLLVFLTLCGRAGGQQRIEPPSHFPHRVANPILAAADAHYARRQELRVGAQASLRPISEAISGYEAAAEDSQNAEARWKLARALYFKGKYTGLDPEARKAVFDKARRTAEEAIEILVRRARAKGTEDLRQLRPAEAAEAVRADPDSAPTFFWAAVAWGEWSLAAGKLEAAKTGAATRIRDYAETLVALDPNFEEGGGYRVLGRLHHQAPRIPFVTSWISRSEALRNLRLALGTNARNFVNRHFLAEALADGDAAERKEAIDLEKSLLEEFPSPSHLVEELFLQQEARNNLQAWGGR